MAGQGSDPGKNAGPGTLYLVTSGLDREPFLHLHPEAPVTLGLDIGAIDSS